MNTQILTIDNIPQPTDPLAADSKHPWDIINIPAGWKITAIGLYHEFEKGEQIQTELTSGPVWVSAIAYGNQKDNWTALIEFLDIDGNQHKLPCGRNRFHEKNNGLIGELAGLGLYVVPGKEQKLLQYLVDCKPDTRLRAVDKLGWLENEQLIYVRQDETVGILVESNDKQTKQISVIYKPDRHVTVGQSTSGTLEDWQINVASKTYMEDMFLFAVCLSFAPPLLKPAQMDSFGFNFSGGTTKGKTTGLQIASSVWGNGADPAAAPESSYIKRWNHTANGLEGLASEHNDSLIGLDELGTCPIKEFEHVTYNLLGGQGKGSMNADRQLKKQRRWRTTVISTGEITVTEKIEQNGRKVKGGQLVRFPDIPFQLSNKITAADIDLLKRACGQYYGVAGKEYLKRLVGGYGNFSTLSADIHNRLDKATNLLKETAGKNLSVEQVRCSKRFALALLAGGLATATSILQCDNQRILDAVGTTFRAYLEASPGISDGERGILAVRDFILRNQSARFLKISTDNTIDKSIRVNNQAGYIVPSMSDDMPGLFLLFPDAFKEACGELGKNAVAATLAENNLLRLDKPDRYLCRYLVDGNRQTFYAIKNEITALDG